MSGEFIIFRKTISVTPDGDGVTATLSSDHDTRLTYTRPYEVHINLSEGNVTPVVVVRFMDAMGSIMSRGDIGIDKPFYLEIASNSLSECRMSVIPMKITDIRYGNSLTVNQKGGQVEYKITFMFEKWVDFVSLEKNRHWVSSTYSDVISEIMTDYDFNVDIEPSEDVMGSIIQPWMTDAQMLNYCIKRAKLSSGDKLLILPLIFQQILTLKSKTAILEENASPASNGGLATLTLGPKNPDYLEYKQEMLDNNGYPNRFSFFDSTMDIIGAYKNFSSGMTVDLYDFETGEVTPTEISPTAQSLTSLSRYRLHNDTSRRHTFTRDPNEVNRLVNNKAVDTFNFKNMVIMVDGCEWFDVGQVVEIIINNANDSGIDGIFSASESGFYMIMAVDHKMTFGDANTYNTVLTLRREGIDSESGGYTSASRFI